MAGSNDRAGGVSAKDDQVQAGVPRRAWSCNYVDRFHIAWRPYTSTRYRSKTDVQADEGYSYRYRALRQKTRRGWEGRQGGRACGCVEGGCDVVWVK